jgi:hypothetical protein
MTTENKDMIIINDVEYDVAEMNEQQKYAVNQVRALNGKIANVQFEIDQLRAAYDTFSNILIQSVEAKDENSDSSNPA